MYILILHKCIKYTVFNICKYVIMIYKSTPTKYYDISIKIQRVEIVPNHLEG